MFKTLVDNFNLLAEASKTEEFPVYPHDYKGNISKPQFIKYMVVFNNTDRLAYSGNARVIPGRIVLSIFYPSGNGQTVPVNKTASLLQIFETKTVIEGLQTDLASLQFMGRDPDNKTLSRADLTIPFNYYGD